MESLWHGERIEHFPTDNFNSLKTLFEIGPFLHRLMTTREASTGHISGVSNGPVCHVYQVFTGLIFLPVIWAF